MLKKNGLLLSLICSVLLVLSGCSGEGAGQKKKELTLVYVEWSSTVASTNVVKAVLENKLGYDVEILPVSAAAMWQSVAGGDADAHVAAWLPTTHESYYEKVKDNVEDLGPNLEGTRIGLVVPTYVQANSIAELNQYKDKFDGKLIGIDPGAGIMSKTEKVIKDYGLQYELIEGSGATMTAVLADSVKNNEWVAVTGWTPHWKFMKWDLKYLEDPKNVYGGAEFINTIVRKGLKEDAPDAYAFLDNFKWEAADMEAVMLANRAEDADAYQNAVDWVNNNPEKVNAWLK